MTDQLKSKYLSPLREIDPEATLQEILMIYDALKDWDGEPASLAETFVRNGYGYLPISFIEKVSRSINYMHYRIKTQKPKMPLPLPDRRYWCGRGNRRYHLYEDCIVVRLHGTKLEGPFTGREVETYLGNASPSLCNECDNRMKRQMGIAHAKGVNHRDDTI